MLKIILIYLSLYIYKEQNQLKIYLDYLSFESKLRNVKFKTDTIVSNIQ